MIYHACIHSISQNDWGMINVLGLKEYMRDILVNICLGEVHMLPAMFSDSINMPSDVISVKSYNQGLYFAKKNCSREKIVHEFGLFQSLWKYITQIHTLKLLQYNGKFSKGVMAYWLITDIYTYFNQNTTSVRFNLQLLTIAEYLDINWDCSNWYEHI